MPTAYNIENFLDKKELGINIDEDILPKMPK